MSTTLIGSRRCVFPFIKDFRNDPRTARKPENSTPHLSNRKEVAR